MNEYRYELAMSGSARRALAERLPEDVAIAAMEFVTGRLLEAPHRVGKPLRDRLEGIHSARLGPDWRVLCQIDRAKRAVVVFDIRRRATAFRRR